MDLQKLSAKAEILIRKKSSEVFNAFADARAMSKFWFYRQDDGLKEGENVPWFIGTGIEAISFDVYVKELKPPNKIVIEWGDDNDSYTQVTWTFKETADNHTILSIEETGFSGSDNAIIKRVLDSKGGFNQVIVAAKAFIEHGIELNVVTDHV